MFDLILLAVFAGITYVVASEGAVGAVTTFFCTLFAGLLAMNFFEPLAGLLDGAGGFFRERSDIIALLGLFAAFVTGLRLACENIAKTLLKVPTLVYEVVRWLGAAATGYVTLAILLTAVHVAPLPREFLGFTPERQNLFGADAPDRRWLGFTRYVSANALAKRQKVVDGSGQLLMTRTRSFDGRTALDEGAEMTDARQPNDVKLPSFLIRYADRRANGAAAAPLAPPPASGGGGGGGGAPAGPAF